MADEITGKEGQPQEPEVEVTPVVTPEVPVGEGTPTPLKKEGEEEVTPEPTPVSVQQRIDRMYARLQTERKGRLKAEQTAAAVNVVTTPKVEVEDENEPITTPGLSESDVERILDTKSKEKEFMAVETEVLVRHPSAINEDGTFNLKDPFCAKYIEIGRRNPHLTTMVDGPRLAEAMAEKELGLSYNKGRIDEANKTNAANNAFTLNSTTTPVKVAKVKLSEEEKRIASRYGMTEDEYASYKATKKVVV